MASKKVAALTPIHEVNVKPYADWPAPPSQIETARAFLRETASNQDLTLICPDKDADGLSAGLVLYKTLVLLGCPPESLHFHFLSKGQGMFGDVERGRMEATFRKYIGDRKKARLIVVDQGSRPGRALVRSNDAEGVGEDVKIETLIIDHHQCEEWPVESMHLTACHSSPICTSSLLTYITCYPLHKNVPLDCDWAAVVGIFGDLGQSEIKFGDTKNGWPVTKEMIALGEACKREGKKTLGDAVSLLNAPRRTAEFNVQTAWDAILAAGKPSDVLSNDALLDAREAVNKEVERCTHTAPKFSKDGRVALFRIDSGFQVHPVIATRWAGTLSKSKKIEMIMVENKGHNPDPAITSFSCRINSSLRKMPEGERPNLRTMLKEYAALASPTFLERVGGDFASGHNEATGGIIKMELFEEFMDKGMEIGVIDPNSAAGKKKRKEEELTKGQTSIGSFFGSPSPKKKAKVS